MGRVSFVFIQKSDRPTYLNIKLTQKRKIEFLESKLGIDTKTTGVVLQKDKQYLFAPYFVNNNPSELINFLKTEFPKGKGKEAAIMTMALRQCGIINMPTNQIDIIRAIANEWGIEIKDPEGFQKVFREIERGSHSNDLSVAIRKIKSFVNV